VSPSAASPALPYVALGDSYTIGTAVPIAERWPDRLVARLAASARPLELVANLGVDGFTSADVIRDELPRLDDLHPEFASVLVGVNDVVQGVPAPAFRANAEHILDVLRSRLPVRRILVVSTPDYTVTPAGAGYGDPDERARGIRRNNEILASLARGHGIEFVDVHDISLRAADDRSLVATDGLHPSGRQYGLWVDRIEPVVVRLLAG